MGTGKLLEAKRQTAVDAIYGPDAGELSFQHSILCQTAMPYRKTDERDWRRENGRAALTMTAIPDAAGELHGLPYGAVSRLVMMHVSSTAVRTADPVIDVGSSLNAFAGLLGISQSGASVRRLADQTQKLLHCHMRLHWRDGDGDTTFPGGSPFSAFRLPTGRKGQGELLAGEARLSDDFLNSLSKHAVPLPTDALAALSGKARALDLFCWLSYRLHRIPRGKSVKLEWAHLASQFAGNLPTDTAQGMRDFRKKFLHDLGSVKDIYLAARIDADSKNVTLRNSPPPIKTIS